MPQFTEDSLRRIMINPFYAITVVLQLTAEHDLTMSETEWIQVNTSLIQGMGARQWLMYLLEVLEKKGDVPDEQINPFHAINIDPIFAVEHVPLIERKRWVDINVLQIRDMGREKWLRQLLDVLNGDIVTAEEVGAAPPLSSSFAYSVHNKRKRRQRHHKRNKNHGK